MHKKKWQKDFTEINSHKSFQKWFNIKRLLFRNQLSDGCKVHATDENQFEFLSKQFVMPQDILRWRLCTKHSFHRPLSLSLSVLSVPSLSYLTWKVPTLQPYWAMGNTLHAAYILFKANETVIIPKQTLHHWLALTINNPTLKRLCASQDLLYLVCNLPRQYKVSRSKYYSRISFSHSVL